MAETAEALFMERLRTEAARSSRIRAELRRSLAFEPGTHVRSFPFVEPLLLAKDFREGWGRRMCYLTAGLWAAHGPVDREGTVALPAACRRLGEQKDSSSIEARFINLLDADVTQLSHRLRQMTALLADCDLDFAHLLRGVLYWNNPARTTQLGWARMYYAIGERTEKSQAKERTTV